jgi:hypothetical protein
MTWKPRGLVIHNTQTPQSFTPQQILSILKDRGLKGYHVLGWRDTTGWHTQNINPLDAPAAHVRLHNHEYAGFAFIADFNALAPDMPLLRAAAVSVTVLLKLYGLTPADIIAHRDVPDQSTDCPGNQFTPALFEQFRTLVAEQYQQAST